MSAAATAAGYLYASGRLRGTRKVRVAVYEPEAAPRREKPKGVPKIEYRTRRWTPNEWVTKVTSTSN